MKKMEFNKISLIKPSVERIQEEEDEEEAKGPKKHIFLSFRLKRETFIILRL